MKTQNPTNFDLNNETLDLLFGFISERLSHGKKGSTKPHLAIIVGQPGAGKSIIVKQIAETFEDKNLPLIIDMDELRIYHPFDKAIFSAHPFLYDDITGRAAGKWNSRLLDMARQNKYETIYQTTLAKKFFTEKIIQEFGNQGYEVSLHCLAVPSKVSILGIYNRFENAFETGETPRWVDIPYHDLAYVQFPKNAQAFEISLPLKTVMAYRRNGKVIYQNNHIDENWVCIPNVQAAIEQDRSRHWGQKQKNVQVRNWRNIVDRYVARFTNTTAEFEQRIVEAKDFLNEAQLFASSSYPSTKDFGQTFVFYATTHHHVFVKVGNDEKLVAFDRDNEPDRTSSILLPKSSTKPRPYGL